MSVYKIPTLYGLMAEFERVEDLVHACELARERGFSRLDAYSPFPVHEISDALGFRRSRVALITIIGGIFGCFGGFSMQYWMSAVSYPVNVGGRPLNSWPSFIPITFEMTVLFAALAAVLGMLALNGLPRPHHPVFNVDRFAFATRDRFFLCIEADDPRFDLLRTREFLESVHSREVNEVLY
jgi:hypothetical protein